MLFGSRLQNEASDLHRGLAAQQPSGDELVLSHPTHCPPPTPQVHIVFPPAWRRGTCNQKSQVVKQPVQVRILLSTQVSNAPVLLHTE